MNTEKLHKRSAYKVIVLVLFATAIILLSLIQSFRPEEILENRTDQQRSFTTFPEARDFEKTIPLHLPEENQDFQVPNPHAPYVVALGKSASASIVEERKRLGMETPKILIWNGQENWKNDDKKDLEFVFSRKCGGCQVTRERKYLKSSVAVVLFNDVNLFKETLPDQRTRTPDQVYVFWCRETQSKIVNHRPKLENSVFDNVFNLTLYFRRDSDVVRYFGNHESALRISKLMESKLGRKKYLESKTKGALWFVSNCDHTYGATQRLLYARSLVKAGLQLDKFGKCFTGPDRVDSKTIDETKYRFYLAFENSIHCADYITEKFWRNGLQAGLVPIVWGPVKEDIKSVAPPNSFIFAEDYEKPEDLVEYLNYLTVNNTAYMEYHHWRDASINDSISAEDIAKGAQASLCRLCKRQVIESHPSKTIPSVSKWMYDQRYIDEECYKNKLSQDQLQKSGINKILKDF